MSHGPQNPGHVLVVPVAHATYFTDIPDSTAADMMVVARRIVEGIKKTGLPAEAFNLKMNSGKAAGQEVMHAHLHIIPRFAGEQLNTTGKISPAIELDAVAERIRKAMQ